ncbi:MAG: hypothetical protein IPP35_07285 [Elusimicrobia bacterium]|nr:hypothetical protein [Elusimicrobiota bacterium]
MSRAEKIVAFILGALLFTGLFVFINSALKTPPAEPPYGDDAYPDAGDEDSYDYTVNTDTMTAEDLIPADENAAGSPVQPPAKPVSRTPPGKKQ